MQRESYTSVLYRDTSEFSWLELISDAPKPQMIQNIWLCCSQMSPHFCLFWVLSPKDEKDHPDLHQWQLQKQTSAKV